MLTPLPPTWTTTVADVQRLAAPVPAGVLAAWFAFGWQVLDATVASLGPSAGPSVVQLWPEHFEAGDVAAGEGRTKLGAPPGDGGHHEPYLYVGPWGPERPGAEGYGNEGFGAVLRYGDLLRGPARHSRRVPPGRCGPPRRRLMRAAGQPGAVIACMSSSMWARTRSIIG